MANGNHAGSTGMKRIQLKSESVDSIAVVKRTKAPEGDGFYIEIDGARTFAELIAVEEHLMILKVNGTIHEVAYAYDGKQWLLGSDIIPEAISAMDEREAHFVAGSMNVEEGALYVNMPGKIVAVLVKVGDTVEAGQGLVIVEAMKMENELKAGKSGVVSVIHVETGATVESGALLLEIVDAN